MIRRTPYVTGSSNGAAPVYSVSTFGDLPQSATTGQRVVVTGESGITEAVCENTAPDTWRVVRATCTYERSQQAEFASTPGTWHNAGGIVVTTAANCPVTLSDKNSRQWLWSTANGAFLPNEVAIRTPALTLGWDGSSDTPAGWTRTVTGATASVSVVNNRVRFALSSGSGTRTATLTRTDAGLTNASAWYARLELSSFLPASWPTAAETIYCLMPYCARRGFARLPTAASGATGHNELYVTGIARYPTETTNAISDGTVIEVYRDSRTTALWRDGVLWSVGSGANAGTVDVQWGIGYETYSATATTTNATMDVRYFRGVRW